MNEIAEENTELQISMKMLKTENYELRYVIDRLNAQIINHNNNEGKKSVLKDIPHYYSCVYQGSTYITDQVMNFEKILYSSCNLCDNADFNITTGIYTNGWPGTYTVTWNLVATDGVGERSVAIYLQKNGEKIEESRFVSSYTGSNGYVFEQGINNQQK